MEKIITAIWNLESLGRQVSKVSLRIRLRERIGSKGTVGVQAWLCKRAGGFGG